MGKNIIMLLLIGLYACAMGSKSANNYNQPRDPSKTFYTADPEGKRLFTSKRCKKFKANGIDCKKGKWEKKEPIDPCSAKGWNTISTGNWMLINESEVLK